MNNLVSHLKIVNSNLLINQKYIIIKTCRTPAFINENLYQIKENNKNKI